MARKGYRTVSIAYKPLDSKGMNQATQKYNRGADVLEEI